MNINTAEKCMCLCY